MAYFEMPEPCPGTLGFVGSLLLSFSTLAKNPCCLLASRSMTDSLSCSVAGLLAGSLLVLADFNVLITLCTAR